MKRPPKSKIVVDAQSPKGDGSLAGDRAAAPGRLMDPALSTLEIVRDPELPTPPEHWTKGALLNVRVAGAEYVVTLYPEEYDDRHPERALRFPNPARCQDFVSSWYSRQHHDPRAR